MSRKKGRLSSQILELPTGRPLGIAKLLTPEQYEEYLEMIQAVVKLPLQQRPRMRDLSTLVQRTFGIKIAPRTINDHVHAEEEKAAKAGTKCN